jgi:deazaflavin-dependent oxidoreductase (nitroreductase family)
MSAAGRGRRAWFGFLGHTLNPIALRSARGRRGPFALIRHVGRKTGTVYETPIIVAPIAGGYVAELTYGRDVAWYKNLVAAGHGTLVLHGDEIAIDGVGDLDAAAGTAAYGAPRSWILKLLRRHDFLLLRVAGR